MTSAQKTKRSVPVNFPEWTIVILPLAVTAIVWFGSTQVLYSADDYQYLHHFAPMRSFADFLRQFYTSDPNSQYWRPLASALAVSDFLIWGWNGMGFHVTNFILHLTCTAVVYYFAKNIFHLPVILASLTMLVFGCAASHEGNILWAAGRTDLLATIFILGTLLAESKSRQGKNRGAWKLFAILLFILSLASKEIGIFALPLMVILLDRDLPGKLTKKIRSSAIQLFPYGIFLLAFVVYRSQFTAPITTAEQFHTEGLHSVSAFAMNSIYTIGYTLLPVDFETATSILNNYRLPLFLGFAIFAIVLAFALYRLMRENGYARYVLPLAFLVITGFFTLQSFERWRTYLPSVGLFIFCAVVSYDLLRLFRKRGQKEIFLTVLLAFFSFHIYRAVGAQKNWVNASHELQRIKEELKPVLASHHERPLRILFLTRPAKLGSAPLLQLSLNDFLSQAELERTNSPDLATGGRSDAGISGETAVLLYAPEQDKEFDGLAVERFNDSTYGVEVGEGSKISLIPAGLKSEGIAKRDQVFHEGDTILTSEVRMILEQTSRITAQRIRIEILDHSLLPVYYDGKKFLY